MESTRKSIAEKRDDTDVSLDAERASAKALGDRAAVRRQRLADELVEHDRLVVDERLRKFRDHADRVLARERVASPARSASVEERSVADRSTRGERELHDSIVEGERQRADEAVLVQRAAQSAAPAETTRRDDTDRKLDAERLCVDRAVVSLDSTEEALSVAEQEIERRSSVLAMVAHELRGPLAVIAVNVDFMAESSVDPAIGEPAAEAQLSVARMERLIRDLLDLARIEGGVLRIAKKPVDVGVLVGEILAAYGPLFSKREVSFVAEPPPPGTIGEFDHDRVLQVLSNLLSNAMKATPAGGTVSLRVERRGGDIELAVKDTGKGMPASALPHVFNRFWQGATEGRSGLGLGLYICERIVRAHGGRIGVESEPGRGTTFRFTLPVGGDARA